MRLERWLLVLFVASVVCLSASAVLDLAGLWGTAQAQSSLGEAWTCSADNIGATLTLACPAPRAGMRIYITDIIAQSTTSTGGSMLLEYGTGTNCGTGTTALLPAAATAVRIGYPALTAAPTVINLVTPLAVPSGKDVCVLGIATQTVTLQMLGRVGP